MKPHTQVAQKIGANIRSIMISDIRERSFKRIKVLLHARAVLEVAGWAHCHGVGSTSGHGGLGEELIHGGLGYSDLRNEESVR